VSSPGLYQGVVAKNDVTEKHSSCFNIGYYAKFYVGLCQEGNFQKKELNLKFLLFSLYSLVAIATEVTLKAARCHRLRELQSSEALHSHVISVTSVCCLNPSV
jgi:hypothetical protein